MSNPTTSLNSAPGASALKSGDWIVSKIFPLNPGSAGAVTPVTLTGIQSFSATPDGGNAIEVFQAGGAEQSYKIRDKQKYKGELTVLGGDFKVPLALSGIKTADFNATNGYGLSFSPTIRATCHLVNSITSIGSTSIKTYEVLPGLEPDAYGIDWSLKKKDEVIKVPFMTDSIPFNASAVDASGNALTMRYEVFAYSSGNSYSLAYLPGLLNSGILPGQYNTKIAEVRKFASSTDISGTVVSDFTESGGEIVLGTNIGASEYFGVLYLATSTANTP